MTTINDMRPGAGRHLLAAATMVFLVGLAAVSTAAAGTTVDRGAGAAGAVTLLRQSDFTYGTYIIDQPGTYRLAEDISFNPNAPAALTAAIESGTIPPDQGRAIGLEVPVDAYHAGMPLPTQIAPGGAGDFTPGGPLDPRYDPAAYGVGFFAAIAITADDVVLDLGGHRIEQSAEHALLQRFFAVIELADQPFVPGQGPASFGTELAAAHNVIIENGTIGRSSHHGIHGNANSNVTVREVAFDGYEVAALALNGVDGLTVRNVTATNRKDVPVLGTFSSARFIQPYVDHLVRSSSGTTLTVGGVTMTAGDIQAQLRAAINNTHHDLVAAPNIVDGRPQIDASAHPAEYAVFHNTHGLLDGNSYSFLVNSLGVAVNGFPTRPDGDTALPSRNIVFHNVEVIDQQAAVNEVIAIDVGGVAAIDPVGAVFQIRNLHPDSGRPITISSSDDASAAYVGNVVSNAQAFVAKAAENGEFESSHLDLSRSNIPAAVLDWVENRPGAETLADVGVSYRCNGDSMFHVDKGVIAYKMDAAVNVRMHRTSVDGLINHGSEGSSTCGDYLDGFSHPSATRTGYGGSTVRGYTFAGSESVLVFRSTARGLRAAEGPAIGFDMMTDSTGLVLYRSTVDDVVAGRDGVVDGGSTEAPVAIGYRVNSDATSVVVIAGCATGLDGAGGNRFIENDSEDTVVVAGCVAVR